MSTQRPRPPTKPAAAIRFVKLLIRPDEDGPGLLGITAGGQRDAYWLKPTVGQGPVRAFELRKFRSGTVYVVRLLPGGARACTCPAWQHRRSCKHADAVAKLAALGRV